MFLYVQDTTFKGSSETCSPTHANMYILFSILRIFCVSCIYIYTHRVDDHYEDESLCIFIYVTTKITTNGSLLDINLRSFDARERENIIILLSFW